MGTHKKRFNETTNINPEYSGIWAGSTLFTEAYLSEYIW